jgi:ribosomal protein S18 acetylase RimI-like enzyme
MTERPRTAAISIAETDPLHPHAQFCLRDFYAELNRRFAAGFDPAESAPAEPGEMRPPAGVFLVATLNGEPVGCGALKFHGNRATELKRMWVSPTVRGLGVGRRLLTELENRAATATSRIIQLETNKTLTEAIAMYRAAGYQQVAPFNDEPYATHWFEKAL